MKQRGLWCVKDLEAKKQELQQEIKQLCVQRAAVAGVLAVLREEQARLEKTTAAMRVVVQQDTLYVGRIINEAEQRAAAITTAAHDAAAATTSAAHAAAHTIREGVVRTLFDHLEPALVAFGAHMQDQAWA